MKLFGSYVCVRDKFCRVVLCIMSWIKRSLEGRKVASQQQLRERFVEFESEDANIAEKWVCN